MTDMFQRKRACETCPFRAEPPKNYTPKRPGDDGLFHGLHPDRVEEIASTLYMGTTFYCHKSVDYEPPADWDEDDGPFEGDTIDGHACVGAMATADRDGYLEQNQMVRISERLGIFKREDFDLDNAPVYDGIEEWVEALTDRYHSDHD